VIVGAHRVSSFDYRMGARVVAGGTGDAGSPGEATAANRVRILLGAMANVGSIARRAEYGLVAAAAVAYAALLGCYLGSPAFKDHVEPSVGAIASALLRGEAPYHGVTGEVSYELPYGPAVFAIHALAFGLFGRAVPVLKMSGLAACIGAAGFTFAILRRRVSLRCASGGLLLVLLYLAYYDARAYWCRPEPFLLLGSASALWLARLHPRWSALGCGVLVAWMFDLKATGPLYLAPVFVLVAANRGRREAVLAALLGGAAGLAVLAIPPLSLGPYLELLGKMAHHGLSARELVLNLTAAAVLLGPVLLVRALRVEGPPVPPQRASWRVPIGTLVACVAVVCVIAAKPGAGRHHLVPFVPLAMDALVDGVDGIERRRLTAGAARALTLAARGALCVLVIALAYGQARAIFLGGARAGRAAIELRSLLSAYAGNDVQMGYGDAASYEDSFGRLLVAFANPLRLDAASQMDSTAAGYTATRMLGEAMASCRPGIWIVPGGEPFSMRSYYGAEGVFDAPFRAAFAQRYELVETRRVYRVYRCRPAR
jgi:hypothetical protein